MQLEKNCIVVVTRQVWDQDAIRKACRKRKKRVFRQDHEKKKFSKDANQKRHVQRLSYHQSISIAHTCTPTRAHTHTLLVLIYSKTSLNCNSSKSTISRHKKKHYKTITCFSRKSELLNDSCCSVFFLLANTRVPSQNADFDDAEEEGYRFLRRLLAAAAKTLSLS